MSLGDILSGGKWSVKAMIVVIEEETEIASSLCRGVSLQPESVKEENIQSCQHITMK